MIKITMDLCRISVSECFCLISATFSVNPMITSVGGMNTLHLFTHCFSLAVSQSLSQIIYVKPSLPYPIIYPEQSQTGWPSL